VVDSKKSRSLTFKLQIVWWRDDCDHFYGVCNLALAMLEIGIKVYFTYSGSEFNWGSVDPELAPNLDPNLDPGSKSDPQERNVEFFLCLFCLS
jgi:hypothetical protein